MSQRPVHRKEDTSPQALRKGTHPPIWDTSKLPPQTLRDPGISLKACGPQTAGFLRVGRVVTAAGTMGTIPMAIPPVSTANPGGILVMKSCAPTCPNSTVSSDGRALSVSCCQGSQCNRSAASGLTGSLGAIWASASISLLWALLRAVW